MSGIPGTPQQFNVQTANQQNLVSWSLSTGSTSYIVSRSLDDITYTIVATLTGTPLAISFLDTAVVLGTTYYYMVAASNISGTSSNTISQSVTPTPTGEMTLSQIRLRAQQRADRVNSNFVTLPEWNSYINQAMFELYDLLVTVYEDYFIATPVSFRANGSTILYPLPDGSLTFNNAITNQPVVARPFYKLLGVDLAINSSPNAYYTLRKFNFAERNKRNPYNTLPTAYGAVNTEYRLLGKNIEFIPLPASGQVYRLWYIPRLIELLQETDTTDIGISGWIEYVIVRAAKFALDKEESDTNNLKEEILFLKQRIEESAANRDAGMPDTISDVRNSGGNGFGFGTNGSMGGF